MTARKRPAKKTTKKKKPPKKRAASSRDPNVAAFDAVKRLTERADSAESRRR